MATTTYFDFTAAARAINARTDSGGTPTADDLSAEEDRLSHEFVTEGWIREELSFAPSAGLISTMNVVIGSAGARSDFYVVPPGAEGQGNYVARLAAAKNVELDAADPTNARVDEIYLVVEDHLYDGNARSLARFGYRTGTAQPAPVAPGADGAWNAYSLLATIQVPAGAPDILSCTITDNRAQSQLVVDAATLDGQNAAFFSMDGHAHAADYAPIAHDGDTSGHPAADAADAGFFTAAGVTKLATLEAGSQVNPSATTLRTQLKAVDGSGSALDADMLDGVHGSGFSTTGHGHTATHYTEAELNNLLANKRNFPGAVFLKRTSSAGTVASGSSGVVGTGASGEQLDDWGGRSSSSTAFQIKASGAGLHLVYGQIEWKYLNTTGFREATLYETNGGTQFAWKRIGPKSGEDTIVQVCAAWYAVSSSDEVQLHGYQNSGSSMTIGTATWLRVISLVL